MIQLYLLVTFLLMICVISQPIMNERERVKGAFKIKSISSMF